MKHLSILMLLQRGWSRSRTLSVSYPAGTTSPLEPRSSTTQVRFFYLSVFFSFVSVICLRYVIALYLHRIYFDVCVCRHDKKTLFVYKIINTIHLEVVVIRFGAHQEIACFNSFWLPNHVENVC